MLHDFHKRKLLANDCPYSLKAAKYFGDTCAPGAPTSAPKSLTSLCNGNTAAYEGDFGALKCLTIENADVAFVSKSTLRKLIKGMKLFNTYFKCSYFYITRFRSFKCREMGYQVYDRWDACYLC